LENTVEQISTVFGIVRLVIVGIKTTIPKKQYVHIDKGKETKASGDERWWWWMGWHRHSTWTKAKKRILNKRSECYAKNKTERIKKE
jgi:hypothetical protein